MTDNDNEYGFLEIVAASVFMLLLNIANFVVGALPVFILMIGTFIFIASPVLFMVILAVAYSWIWLLTFPIAILLASAFNAQVSKVVEYDVKMYIHVNEDDDDS